MGYNFRVVKTNDNGRTFVEAVCDDCGKKKFVRKSWAVGKIRNYSVEYLCKACSGKRNIRKALRVKNMDTDVIDEYVWIASEIFSNLYDDLHPRIIAKKIGNQSINLIEMAREFVYNYINYGVDQDVITCAEHIENNAGKEILGLYDWRTGMDARAMITLEQLPRPEGI